MDKTIFLRYAGRYWLIVGLLTYVIIAVSSIIRSLEPMGFFTFMYLAVDWFASCVYYFFAGAMIGFGIDVYCAKKSRSRITIPLWLILTLGLWIISSVTVAIIQNDQVSTLLIIIFPLAFSIFFTGYAFLIVFPDVIVYSYLGKFFFDIVFLSVFGTWLYLSCKVEGKNMLARILLAIIFAIFFLGFVGCAASLAK